MDLLTESQPARLEGVLERLTFVNEESGWTVAQLRAADGHDLITVVGVLPGVQLGENLWLQGRWVKNKKFGQQFEVEKYETVIPSTELGIRRYLGSGMIKGIGPKMADRLVDVFGAATLEVLEKGVHRLQEVEGIGPKRARWIHDAWVKQKAIREVMIFLQGHGVSVSFAAKIFKAYGSSAVDMVKSNPFRLARDIPGIGFRSADKIASELGFSPDSPVRAEAGILYNLQELLEEGHCFCEEEALLGRCGKSLDVPLEVQRLVLPRLVEEGWVVRERISAPDGESRIFPKEIHDAEVSLALRLNAFLAGPKPSVSVNAEAALDWVQRKMVIRLADQQREAIRRALTAKALIVTGGPGTGKTTIVRGILDILERKGLRIRLAAPTGRAAKRLTEATGRPAQTIHRLLKFEPRQMSFEFNARNPLPLDLLILDEASMIDLLLMNHLMGALPVEAGLIWVGDVDQLPSVGPGQVLRDLIDSGACAVIRLTEIFRQAEGTAIARNAHRIKSGLEPEWSSSAEDFFFVEREDPEEAAATIREIVVDRIPGRFGLSPKADIQVLTPMHRGHLGVANLNALLQDALNPGGESVQRYGRRLHRGDKVMQIRNNYDKDVFNGDIGFIVRIQNDEQEVTVEMDAREVVYDFSELDELALAYAVSIHKSQGSEYPAVVIPLHTQHYVMLQRNLLYTAVTRGKKLVVLVGTKKALAAAVRNTPAGGRCTMLAERLAFSSQPDSIRKRRN